MPLPSNFQEQLEQALRLRNGRELVIFTRRTFLQRLGIIPFETAFMLYAIYSGISGLCNFGDSNTLFNAGTKWAVLLNIYFMLTGGAALVGAGTKLYNIEAFGLLGIIGSLIIRAMVIVSQHGWDPASHNLLFLSVILTAAASIRLWLITNYSHVTQSGVTFHVKEDIK